MSFFSSRLKAIFDRAWRRYGQPVLTAVPPLVDWSLPAGYNYDSARDAVVTGSGASLADLTDLAEYYAGETVYIVPQQPSADLKAMTAAGIAPSGQIDVYILAADVDCVQEAFAVQIDGQWYNVLEVSHGPAGISGNDGIWATARLQRRS